VNGPRWKRPPTGGPDPAGNSAEAVGAADVPAAEIVRLGGLPIRRMDRRSVVDQIFSELASGRGGWLITANIDFVQRAATDPAMREQYLRADLIVADGIPLIWAARLKGQPIRERSAGSDLVWLLAERAADEGRSIYLLGGQGGAAEGAAKRLMDCWPALRIAGWSSPWISSPPTCEELDSIREELARARPDLVYVAFGTPKQEFLIDALRSDFPGAWMMGCGISLSFIAGDVVRAPRWMQRAGLEWIHRLVQEPGRLARRYLLKNLPFSFRLLLTSWLARR
jgi:N-acetylglucosaminyldiphosphoundecaprenol N-acetyl-beta-D-mannosaminyltransferase